MSHKKDFCGGSGGSAEWVGPGGATYSLILTNYSPVIPTKRGDSFGGRARSVKPLSYISPDGPVGKILGAKLEIP